MLNVLLWLAAVQRYYFATICAPLIKQTGWKTLKVLIQTELFGILELETQAFFVCAALLRVNDLNLFSERCHLEDNMKKEKIKYDTRPCYREATDEEQ